MPRAVRLSDREPATFGSASHPHRRITWCPDGCHAGPRQCLQRTRSTRLAIATSPANSGRNTTAPASVATSAVRSVSAPLVNNRRYTVMPTAGMTVTAEITPGSTILCSRWHRPWRSFKRPRCRTRSDTESFTSTLRMCSVWPPDRPHAFLRMTATRGLASRCSVRSRNDDRIHHVPDYLVSVSLLAEYLHHVEPNG